MKKYLYLVLGAIVVTLIAIVGIQSKKLKALAFKLLRMQRDAKLQDIRNKSKALDSKRKAQSEKRRKAMDDHRNAYNALMAKLGDSK